MPRAVADYLCPATEVSTWKDLDDKSAKGLPAKPWGRIAINRGAFETVGGVRDDRVDA